MSTNHIFTALLILIILNGCGLSGLVRKTAPQHKKEVSLWQKIIADKGGNGMWLIRRGYHYGEDILALASFSYYSHIGILNLDKNEIIEAHGAGTVSTPLKKFLKDSHRIMLVRPKNWTPQKGKLAVLKAQAQLGKKYDFFAGLGFPDENKWYCSELASWVWGKRANSFESFLHPAQFKHLGTILFESNSYNNPSYATLRENNQKDQDSSLSPLLTPNLPTTL